MRIYWNSECGSIWPGNEQRFSMSINKKGEIEKMKKYLVALGLLVGLAGISRAGTPQETYWQGQAPLSGTTIIASSSTASGSTGAFTLTVATPTVINSGGGSYNGRICIKKFVIEVSSVATVTIKDNNTSDWTLYGAAIGTNVANTLQLTDDHLAPFCITS